MPEPFRILLLEDNPTDVELIQFELREAGFIFISKVAVTEADFLHELQEYCPDLILSDYDLPQYNGALALAESRSRCPDIPFILVTGALSEDHAIEILTRGAKDYVLKTRLQQRLAPAVRRVLAEAEEHRGRKRAEAELREAHRTLEERVRIRTAELEAEIETRKKTTAALRESEERHRTIIQTAMDGFWLVDRQGNLLDVNKTYCQVSGYSEQELLAMSIPDLEATETSKDTLLHIQKIIVRGEDRFETRHRRKDGTIFDVEISVQYRPSDGGQFVVFLHDISNRKRAEKRTMASLQEKETLLREIHHRVKNNLQIISSLLKLQARQIADEKLKGVFQECQDRIKAMAAVHSMLYKSQNFAEINFGEYVRGIAGQLFRSYKTSSAAISLIIQADKVLLPIDTAIPLGLIINELVSNTLKYAFPVIRKGKITIEINHTEYGLRLLYEDDGVGFPKDVDFKKAETMGLKLVNMLVEQLGGTIEQLASGGTGYLIRFKTQSLAEVVPDAQ